MPLSEILTRINWVDVLAIILLLKIGYEGFDRGFSGEILPAIGIFTSLVITFYFYVKFGNFIAEYTPLSSRFSYIFSYIAIATIVIFIAYIIEGYITGKVATLHVASFYERSVGLLLGILRATIIIAMLLIALDLLPFEYIHDSIKKRSLTGDIFLKAGHFLYSKTARLLGLTK